MATKHIQVEIITIGTEILIGQIVDTNSAWMGVELNRLGFEVVQITSVHDDAAQITAALDAALDRADAVLITGGIGPTKDDITKQTLCRYFDTRLVFSEEVYDNIVALFHHRPYVMNELTKAQANVPEACTVIQNAMGTAPITWFERGEKVIVSMPGVPYEMKNAMRADILPRLKAHFRTPTVHHRTVLVYGIPESQLAIRLNDWEDALPSYIHLAYLPNYGIIRLRLSGVNGSAQELDAELDRQIALLHPILGEAIVIEDDVTVEEYISNLLKSKNLTLSIAESCTGGNIAHHITLLPGSSAFFKGSVVAYSNDVKTDVLGVNAQAIESFGAVSREVVEQMAQGARRLLGTDIALAVSGIAGPDGGTEEKPVGTVWIAAAGKEGCFSQSYQFGPVRAQNIERATQAALLAVRQVVD